MPDSERSTFRGKEPMPHTESEPLRPCVISIGLPESKFKLLQDYVYLLLLTVSVFSGLM